MKERDVDATWTSTAGLTTLHFTQKAGALGLSVAKIDRAATPNHQIQLASTATDSPLNDDKFTDKSKQIKVTKNGTPLEYNASLGAGQFSYANGVITLGDDIVTGQTYKIYVQAGDAEAEEVTVTVAAYDLTWTNSGSYALAAAKEANTYTLVIRGVAAGYSATIAAGGTDAAQIASCSTSAQSPAKVGNNGELIVKFTTLANATAADKSATVTVTVNGNNFVINVTQAH